MTIALGSVETNIEIRNERMAEHVFAGMDAPTIAAIIDMAALRALTDGQSFGQNIEAVLSFGSQSIDLDAAVHVTRLSENRVMVVSDDMLFVSAEDLDITGAIDKLMELAELPSITRTMPVTFRFVFDAADPATASTSPVTESAPIQAVAAAPVLGGDPVAGKKVFKKCKACHVVDEEKNKVGPHLVGIIGRPAAAVEGFKYSAAFKKLDGEWTHARLTEFLRKPRKYVKGTKMSFGGLRKDDDIANVLAYLASEK